MRVAFAKGCITRYLERSLKRWRLEHSCFPIYLSLDVELRREFTVRMPFKGNAKRKKVSIGILSQDVTNRLNPHDVFNNNQDGRAILFGEFAGLQRA